MTRALFEVGERVKLVSKSFPEHNGEYTVRVLLTKDSLYFCRIVSKPFLTPSIECFSYILEENCYATGSFGQEQPWKEESLRKLYPPSNFSFEELLSELKQGKMVNIEA